MTDKQPKALSIAKRLKNQQQPLSLALREKAAAELRRLHEVNAELVEALRVALIDLRLASDSGDFGLEFEPAILRGQKAISNAIVVAE